MTNPKKQNDKHINMQRRSVLETEADILSHGACLNVKDTANAGCSTFAPLKINPEIQRLIMNAALDAIICINTNGDITFWNPQAEIIFGWLCDEVLGKKLSSLIIPEQYRNRHDEGIAIYLKTGKGPALNKLLELSALHKNGKEFPIELTVMPIKEGGEEFFCAFIRDITQRRKAEKALQDTYDEKNTILESIGDAFFAVDRNWIVTYWNKEAEKKFHTPKAVILGNNLWEVFPTGVDSISYKKYHEALKTNRVVNFADHYPELNAWYEISVYPSPSGLSVYFKDITEHKRSEINLEKAYQEKNTILESIDDGFFAVDRNSLVTYWNRKAEILLGESRESIIGKNIHDMFANPDSRDFYDNYQKAIRENSTVHFEAFSKRSNKWFAVSAFASSNGLSVHFKDVSERRAFEEKIKESEFRYRSLIEQATDTICVADENTKFIDINPSGCQMFGYSREEFLELNMLDVLFIEDMKTNPLQFGMLKEGKTTSNERRVKRKDGSAIDVELNAKMLEDGKVLIFGRDITERKKAENKLKESELRYRSIIEQATDAICMADASMKIIDVNLYCCEMLGYTKEEFLRLTVMDVFIAEDLIANPFKIAELQTGKVIRNERRFKRKDGTIIEVEMSGRILEDGRFLVFGHDIAERKKAEQLIIQSEAKYRTLFEQNMAGVYQTTASGEIVNCNNAFAKMLKYDSPAELQKINASELYFSATERNDFTRQVMSQKKITNYESVLKCKDGSPLYFIENISLRKDDITGEEFFYGIIIDITEKKQAELQLKESNERYNLISKATNDMVWDWNLETGEVYRNKEGWKKIFGNEEVDSEIGAIDDWDSRIHPDDIGKVKEVNDEILNSGKNFFEVECRMRRNDGAYVYIHDRGHIIRNKEGKPVRLIGATQNITLRKEAELKVAKSELRFRSLVQNSSDLISIFNESAYFIYSSPAIKSMLGYEPEETIEKNAFSFIHPDDIDILKMHLKKGKEEKTLQIPTFRFRNAKGEWRWLESKISDLSDNPEIMGYVFNSRDVTERKLAEEEIKKLSIIAKETVNAVIVTDTEEKIVWVNEAFTRITEFKSEEVIGKRPSDFLLGEESNPETLRFMNEKMEKLQPFECDIVNYTKSGKKYWMRIQCQPQFDEAGNLKHFFAIETDITKEKEAEEILKASEERYRYLFNNNPACICIWDIETLKILEVNNTAIELYGFSRDEFLTKRIFDFSPEKHKEKLRQFAVDAYKDQDFRSEMICKHHKNAGEVMYMQISSHRIEFRGRKVILGLANNITDKIILEKELENQKFLKQQEITQAVISAQEHERQEIGGELHDNINQILAGSLLYIGLAKRELKIEHPYLIETDKLINSAITEIRKLSHTLIPPALHESELVSALINIVEVTQKTSGLQIKLHTYDFDETAIPDKLKLNIYRIIQEQFNNILKHSHAKKVTIRLIQDNEKTLLSIKDDGIGFDTSQKAAGVGIMNMKTRASIFNGELNITSSPGNGCELRVLFNYNINSFGLQQ